MRATATTVKRGRMVAPAIAVPGLAAQAVVIATIKIAVTIGSARDGLRNGIMTTIVGITPMKGKICLTRGQATARHAVGVRKVAQSVGARRLLRHRRVAAISISAVTLTTVRRRSGEAKMAKAILAGGRHRKHVEIRKVSLSGSGLITATCCCRQGLSAGKQTIARGATQTKLPICVLVLAVILSCNRRGQLMAIFGLIVSRSAVGGRTCRRRRSDGWLKTTLCSRAVESFQLADLRGRC